MQIFEKVKNPDLGLLIIRLFFGLGFIQFGLKKFLGGAPGLEKLGSALEVFGITAFPLFFGTLAAAIELLGGFLVCIGYQFRLATLGLILVMIVAFSSNFEGFGPLGSLGNALWSFLMSALFLGLFFVGPGKYSFDTLTSLKRNSAFSKF